ncbi:MAG: hypothetical protein M3044_06230 [Thermoproteota archaeon]|nr:hypothetical protein [Thermoproteota archaeon]
MNAKRSVVLLIAAVVFAVSIGVTTSPQSSIAQMSSSSSSSGNMTAGGSSQNQTNMMMGTYGPNITGSIALGPTIAKAIASQVHVNLANASMIAEKAVGANAHSAAVRIGVVHGFLVYMALVVDSSNNFHGVLVDAGNGQVLGQLSLAALMRGGMMGPSMGMMMGPSMGMHQGMMYYPGMMG